MNSSAKKKENKKNLQIKLEVFCILIFFADCIAVDFFQFVQNTDMLEMVRINQIDVSLQTQIFYRQNRQLFVGNFVPAGTL